MYTETNERSGLTSVGALEKGSMGVFGGAYSGIVRISNCEMREIVMLRYVGILVDVIVRAVVCKEMLLSREISVRTRNYLNTFPSRHEDCSFKKSVHRVLIATQRLSTL